MFAKNRYHYLIILLISIIAFHFNYGLEKLDPTNINWLMSAYHDWGTHYLGWAFYRNDPWTFPIGTVENYNYPAGTNVGFTDSIPILAIFFKFFSFLLPAEFQYFGIWLFLCFFLNGIFSFKIFKLFYNQSSIILILATTFIIVNPVLMYRGMHPALCAHWLILASIYYYLKKSNLSTVYKINRSQIILAILSALVSPYLFLMVIGFNLITPFKHFLYDKTINFKKAVFFPIIAISLVLIVWFLVGMITFNNDKGLEVIDSYGLYGFNLNNFYNGGGYSKFLPELKWTNPHQYEGFAYLGIGFIFLVIVVVVGSFFNLKVLKPIKRFTPLVLLTLFFILFAITNKVSLGDQIILEYPTLDIIKKIGNIFRASGRFIWIFCYLLYLVILVFFIRFKFNFKIKAVLLSLLLVLQVYDISPLISFRNLPDGKYELEKFDKEWFTIVPNFEKIVTYPPFQFDLLTTMDYQDLCYLALKNDIPITCGYVARESGDENSSFQDKLKENLSKGEVDVNTLYITTTKYLEDFNTCLNKNNLEIRFLNGYYLIYKKTAKRMFVKKSVEIKKQDSIYGEILKEKPVEVKNAVFVKDKIKYYIEEFNDNGAIRIKGWAFLNGSKNNSKDSIFISVRNKNRMYVSKAKTQNRTDISEAFGGNLDNSGFRATILDRDIEKGLYKLFIGLKAENSTIVFEEIIPEIETSIKMVKKLERIDKLPVQNLLAKGNLDILEVNDNKLKIRGWSIIPESKVRLFYRIILSNSKVNYLLETNSEIRSDITASFKNGFNYDNSGFNLSLDTKSIEKGIYNVFVLFEGDERQIFNPKRTIKID